MRPEIRPDEFTAINLEREGDVYGEVAVNAKYDRVDFYRPLGLYMLKIYDDEDGLMTIFTDQTNAMLVAQGAELPFVERDFIFQSEYEGYLTAQERHVTDDEWNLDIDEASIIEAVARELDDEAE